MNFIGEMINFKTKSDSQDTSMYNKQVIIVRTRGFLSQQGVKSLQAFTNSDKVY